MHQQLLRSTLVLAAVATIGTVATNTKASAKANKSFSIDRVTNAKFYKRSKLKKVHAKSNLSLYKNENLTSYSKSKKTKTFYSTESITIRTKKGKVATYRYVKSANGKVKGWLLSSTLKGKIGKRTNKPGKWHNGLPKNLVTNHGRDTMTTKHDWYYKQKLAIVMFNETSKKGKVEPYGQIIFTKILKNMTTWNWPYPTKKDVKSSVVGGWGGQNNFESYLKYQYLGHNKYKISSRNIKSTPDGVSDTTSKRHSYVLTITKKKLNDGRHVYTHTYPNKPKDLRSVRVVYPG
ncbi:hypothetical protein D1831_11020 [Lactiplantibacillus garii]|uniref:Uncharacterized protein n=1 Tax=Lactiplantibacillus garii TaxID=2306423 RepID=A0A426D556_9LACO|nr:hypothetical protein [Lactiplantibacillus garii]RRK09730.1 hypothetical protein D1831_11020 [Lactiplantibacillus garii]